MPASSQTTAPPVTGPEPEYEAMRRILRGLGADEDLVARVLPWADLGGNGYVYVPPLPAVVVAHLVRLLPVVAA